MLYVTGIGRIAETASMARTPGPDSHSMVELGLLRKSEPIPPATMTRPPRKGVAVCHARAVAMLTVPDQVPDAGSYSSALARVLEGPCPPLQDHAAEQAGGGEILARRGHAWE